MAAAMKRSMPCKRVAFRRAGHGIASAESGRSRVKCRTGLGRAFECAKCRSGSQVPRRARALEVRILTEWRVGTAPRTQR